jgi:tetratricopeptide (TPR) repeat protein
MIHRALLLGFVFALPLPAADPPPEIIDEKALEPGFKELFQRLDQVKKSTLPMTTFAQHYRDQAQAKGTPRERAEAAFFNGFVLSRVLDNSKDGKREFQRAIDLAPGLLLAYVQLALLAEQAGDHAEAERLLEYAIGLKPENVRARVQLGHMAQRRGELDRAKKIYTKCIEVEADLEAIVALIRVNTRLFQTSFDEKAKEEYAREALDLADAIVTLQSDDQRARTSKAQVLLELGRVKEASNYLEGLYAEGTLKPEVEVEVLLLLRGIYQQQVNVDGVKSALDRLLKNKALRPEERAKIAAGAKDVESMGKFAFTKWGIEDHIQMLNNPGLSVENRVTVLRRLIGFCTSETADNPVLQPLVKRASDECFRRLVDPQPELVVTQLRALRALGPPPRMMYVLVHFLYPQGVTEDVREEACRIVATAGGVAAIPSLYYSLQDDSGKVVREADSQLSVLCERRSQFGGGIDPLTPDQIKQARRMWTDFFHTEEGATLLTKSFESLSACVIRVNPTLTAAPMIDHAANVLLDGDVPWNGWAAAYAFLVSYWGKDFRPVDRRGKQVEPSEREAITDAFEAEFNPPEEEEKAPQPPSNPAPAKANANAGMPKGK